MTSYLVSREAPNPFGIVPHPLELELGAGFGAAPFHLFHAHPSAYPPRMQHVMLASSLPMTTPAETAKQGLSFQTLDASSSAHINVEGQCSADVTYLDTRKNTKQDELEAPLANHPSPVSEGRAATSSPPTSNLAFAADVDTNPPACNSIYTQFNSLSFTDSSTSGPPSAATVNHLLASPHSELCPLQPQTMPNANPTNSPAPSPNTLPNTPNSTSPRSPSSQTSNTATTPISPGKTTPEDSQLLPASQSLPHSTSAPNLAEPPLTQQQQWDASVFPVALSSPPEGSQAEPQPKLASKQLLEICRQQGLVPRHEPNPTLPIQPSDTFSVSQPMLLTTTSSPHLAANPLTSTAAHNHPMNQLINTANIPVTTLNSAAISPAMHGAHDGTTSILSGVVEVMPGGMPAGMKPGTPQFCEKMMYRNSDSKMVMMPTETFVSMRQQLEATKSDKARLSASLKSAQNACARKDEQIMDLQRRHGLLVQQYNSLQSMYQGVLNQLQQEQQQYASSSIQLQGEMQSKQQVEQLLQMLNKQLQQEQQQKKAISVKLASEAASRQQLHEQVNALTVQLQQQAGSTETVQWLQGVKKKLEDEVRAATGQLHQEQKRRSDMSMQLQSALTEKQQLQAELSALRAQLQHHSSHPSSMDSHFSMQHQQQQDEVVLKFGPQGMPHPSTLTGQASMHHGSVQGMQGQGLQDLVGVAANDGVQVMGPPQGRGGVVGYGQLPINMSSAMVVQAGGPGGHNGGGHITGFGSLTMPVHGSF